VYRCQVNLGAIRAKISLLSQAIKGDKVLETTTGDKGPVEWSHFYYTFINISYDNVLKGTPQGNWRSHGILWQVNK